MVSALPAIQSPLPDHLAVLALLTVDWPRRNVQGWVSRNPASQFSRLVGEGGCVPNSFAPYDFRWGRVQLVSGTLAASLAVSEEKCSSQIPSCLSLQEVVNSALRILGWKWLHGCFPGQQQVLVHPSQSCCCMALGKLLAFLLALEATVLAEVAVVFKVLLGHSNTLFLGGAAPEDMSCECWGWAGAGVACGVTHTL